MSIKNFPDYNKINEDSSNADVITAYQYNRDYEETFKVLRADLDKR